MKLAILNPITLSLAAMSSLISSAIEDVIPLTGNPVSLGVEALKGLLILHIYKTHDATRPLLGPHVDVSTVAGLPMIHGFLPCVQL